MADNPSEKWPGERYEMGIPPGYLHALGMVTFAYNQLEVILGIVLESCLTEPDRLRAQIVDKLNNRERVDLLTEIATNFLTNRQIADHLLFGLKCFNICNENRNVLMHAVHREQDSEHASLEKRASGGPLRKIVFDLPLTDFRRVAEETIETSYFLMSNVQHRYHGETLNDKFPLPGKLTLRPPAQAQKDARPPPESSRA
jgi:hypothetical protein